MDVDLGGGLTAFIGDDDVVIKAEVTNEEITMSRRQVAKLCEGLQRDMTERRSQS